MNVTENQFWRIYGHLEPTPFFQHFYDDAKRAHHEAPPDSKTLSTACLRFLGGLKHDLRVHGLPGVRTKAAAIELPPSLIEQLLNFPSAEQLKNYQDDDA